MSRIGLKPVTIPAGVEIKIDEKNVVTVKGPKGELTQPISPLIKAEVNDNELTFSRDNDDREKREQHGLARALVANMVHGVSEGYKKTLELVGVGYRAAMEGKNLNMALGYSHPVLVEAPEGITFAVEANTKITVSGTNKQAVGDIAAFIRGKRPPEVYKGKGVKYEGEYIRRKAGKAGKK